MTSSFSSCNQWTLEWAQKNQIPSHFLPKTDSTNAWAKKEFTETTALYLADHQTQGRGRYERTWINAEPGSTLLSTWCFSSPSAPNPILSARAGLKIYQALVSVFPQLHFSLKAPNDIYLADGKLLGLLIELQNRGVDTQYFFGIGLNVFAKPEELGFPTSCLSEKTLVTRDHWNRLCHLLYTGLQEICRDAHRSQLLESEKKHLLEALNQHPSETYKSISSQGQLTRSDGSNVLWMDL